MSAPVYVNAGTAAATGAGTTVTPGLPASIVAGNLLFMYLRCDSAFSVATPSGWTPASSSGLTAVWFRIATGGESAPALSWTGTKKARAQIFQFSGNFPALGAVVTNVSVNSGAGTSITDPALTTTSADSLVIELSTTSLLQTIPTPAGWTSRSSTASSNISVNLIDKTVAGPAATSGSITQTISSQDWSAEMFEIRSPTPFLYVALGNGIAMSSPDGAAWTTRTIPAGGWADVCYAASIGMFVAVANAGTNRVATSPDGINWTARTPATVALWHCVEWSPTLNLFVALSNDGAAMSSPDGVTWTTRTASANNSWDSVVWAATPANFYAVADDTNVAVTTRAAHSSNGTSWSNETTPLAPNQNGWIGIAYAPSLNLLASCASSGTTQRVMTSPVNGVWTLRTTPNFTMRGICWSIAQTLFCVVGNSGSSTQNIATSPDGTTWTAQSPTTPLRDVCFSEAYGKFCAVGDAGAVLTSPTGVTWTTQTAASASDYFTVTSGGSYTATPATTAAISQTLFAPTQAVAAKEIGKVAGAQTLLAPTQAVTAKEIEKATVAQTLFAPTQAMAAKEIEKAAAAQTLFAPTQEIDVTQFYRAVVAQTLFAPTLSATDVEIEPGAIAQTLAGFTQAAAATSSSLDVTTVAQTLFAPTQDAEVVERESATADQTLFAPMQEADATEREPSAIAQTLFGITQAVAGHSSSLDDVAVDQTLFALSQDAEVVESELAAIDQTLPGIQAGGDVVTAYISQVLCRRRFIRTARGDIEQSLPGFTQSIVARNGSRRGRHLGFPGGCSELERASARAKIEAARVVGIAELEFFRSRVYARGVDARVPPPEVARHNLTSSAYHKARPVTVPAHFKGKPK